MGKAGMVAVPTWPFTATGHRSCPWRLQVTKVGKPSGWPEGAGWGIEPESVRVPAEQGWSEKLPRLTEAQTFPFKSQKCVHAVTHTETYNRHTDTPQSNSYSAVTAANMYIP